MLAKYLISDVVPSLRTSDTGTKALSWMEFFRISHLPIVNSEELLGLISDTDIYDLNMADEPIGNHKLSLIRPYIKENAHIYEVIEIVARLNLTIIPVLDEKNNYLGVITMHNLVRNFADLTAAKQPGGIIVLELNENDYSLSEIAQIIESNDAKVLGFYLHSPEDTMQLDITIKINKTDLAPVIQTFNRYDYTIKASFMHDDEMDVFYKNRFESFMNYLNI